MTDYISREAAIRNVCKGCGLFDTDNCICTGKVGCGEYHAILDTPAADVKPVVRGEWKQTGDHSAICTACGKTTLVGGADRTGKALIHKGLFQFCPNCGADMREEINDE